MIGISKYAHLEPVPNRLMCYPAEQSHDVVAIVEIPVGLMMPVDVVIGSTLSKGQE
jgi:hypothetical protein